MKFHIHTHAFFSASRSLLCHLDFYYLCFLVTWYWNRANTSSIGVCYYRKWVISSIYCLCIIWDIAVLLNLWICFLWQSLVMFVLHFSRVRRFDRGHDSWTNSEISYYNTVQSCFTMLLVSICLWHSLMLMFTIIEWHSVKQAVWLPF